MAGLEGSLVPYGVMRRTYHSGIPDIGLLFALNLKYLENDSEFYYYWALSSEETRVK